MAESLFVGFNEIEELKPELERIRKENSVMKGLEIAGLKSDTTKLSEESLQLKKKIDELITTIELLLLREMKNCGELLKGTNEGVIGETTPFKYKRNKQIMDELREINELKLKVMKGRLENEREIHLTINFEVARLQNEVENLQEDKQNITMNENEMVKAHQNVFESTKSRHDAETALLVVNQDDKKIRLLAEKEEMDQNIIDIAGHVLEVGTNGHVLELQEEVKEISKFIEQRDTEISRVAIAVGALKL
ncbi:uncharacterized protein [Rutidosis leptorrhynchoides]|uniref:uncharacterized protein n=1 Tax=Rutidosis leptorrhynchoides TaxID=125765 RepID=UPI003A99D711